MKPNPVFLTDLLILRELFAPGEDFYVIDPASRVTGNSEDIPSPLRKSDEKAENASFVADLRNGEIVLYSSSCGDERWLSFDYINNPDGTIRWFYPSAGIHAGHLSLYNAASVKARLYKILTRIAWKLGQSHRLASGTFRVQQKLYESVQKRYGINFREAASFFTGTRSATRKLVIELHDETRTTGFIKVPLTTKAATLIENEYNMVKSLSKYDFTSLSLPTLSSRINGHARLSDVKPAIVIPADRINNIHLNAMAELFAISHETRRIEETPVWEVIENNLQQLTQELVFVNELNKEKTLDLIGLLKTLFQRIPATEKISLSVSHGDFTPWNMYCDEQRLFVYDWEMAQNGIPMFFDLIHFTYQSTVLRQRKNYATVKCRINEWSQQPLAQKLMQKYHINLALHQQLYLLFTAGHYLRQYLAEKELLMQSHWMIDAWTDAIRDVLQTTHQQPNQP